jgi:hypothetical protein
MNGRMGLKRLAAVQQAGFARRHRAQPELCRQRSKPSFGSQQNFSLLELFFSASGRQLNKKIRTGILHCAPLLAGFEFPSVFPWRLSCASRFNDSD